MTPAPPPEDRCESNAAAYALGALEPAEADVFRRHLESCAICAAELEAFGQVVDVLAQSAPLTPAPRALKRQVMRAVAAEPRPDVRPARRPPRTAFTLAGAVAGLAAAAVGLVLVLSGGESGRARTISAAVTGRGTAALVINSADRAKLVVRRLPAAPRGRIYEVWLQRGSATPVPAQALFRVDEHGDAAIQVPGSMRGVSRLMVTLEPAGGTLVPTRTPVITARL